MTNFYIKTANLEEMKAFSKTKGLSENPKIAWISILDPNKPEPLFEDSPNKLTEYFYDVPYDLYSSSTKELEYAAITQEQADRIAKFVHDNSQAGVFIINCTAGVARSGAIAEYIYEKIGEKRGLSSGKFREMNRHIVPNLDVKQKLHNWVYKEKKVLFLDIDGVLNSELFFEARSFGGRQMKFFTGKNKKRVDNLNFWSRQISERSISCINRIVEDTGCEVVLSSTWRKYVSIPDMNTILKKRGATFSILNKTEVLFRERGLEIQKYIQENCVTTYCILDDDVDMLDSQLENFVRTDPFCGINWGDRDKCIAILGSETYDWGTGSSSQKRAKIKRIDCDIRLLQITREQLVIAENKQREQKL